METEIQSTAPHENGSKVEESISEPPQITNGKESPSPKETKTAPKVPKRARRSRSKTPQTKKDLKEENINGHMEDQSQAKETIVEEVEDKNTNGQEVVEKEAKHEEDNVEMESLIIVSDEPDPELQFDESSDKDSGKGSPIQTRCKTRRSHNRNIPSPKTPKTATPEIDDVNDVSTVAEAGGDSTRLDFTAHSEESFVNQDKSFSDTIRSLSARKTIRPINDSYRLKAFENLKAKVQLDSPKRKRSVSPEERKKFKQDECLGTVNRLRNKFSRDASPMLMGYKDGSKDFHTDVVEDGDKKSWCVVM